MFNFDNYSIKIKLIIIFVVFKVLPLFLLSYIGISSFKHINNYLSQSSELIIKNSQSSIENTTNSAISDSIKALDKKSQETLEAHTLTIAHQVADFLHKVDKNILDLSKKEINENTLINFYNLEKKYAHYPIEYFYDKEKDNWVPKEKKNLEKKSEVAQLKENAKEFHKTNPKPLRKKLLPIYKEITYYDLSGKEIFKVSSLNDTLRDISLKQNTYIHAENYYKESLNLQKGEIFVSKVIGEYLPSLIIGSFTKKKAKKLNIEFEPEKHAYAGAENPIGKEFEGIIRFVTPVYKDDKKVGFLTFALDHKHIMDFTDFVNPLSATPMDISNASSGNYAFMWSSDFKNISHPRDYFINGYDSKTGKEVPGWIDSKMAKSFKASGEKNLNSFLKKQPTFFNQALDKKPNIEQINIGQLGLDCRYLNFSPQCQGWSQLTKEGGYGSFIIFFSGVWKLTTAAVIPYYTGQYANSKRGFGFVTIGANVDEFHKAAIRTKENIDKIFKKENDKIRNNITKITKNIGDNIKSQIEKMTIVTILLILLIIYIAILISNNISKRITNLIIATEKLKNENFNYTIESTSNDELGELTNSFNEMAQSICLLNNDLKEKLYTDDLTSLKNRRAFEMEIKNYKDPIIYLLDIDTFKNINDYYGVEAGNFVLIELSNELSKISKYKNLEVYRMGSDEFVILGENPNPLSEKLSIVFIEELGASLSKKYFSNEKLNIGTTITLSCGISTGIGNLLEKADLALNEAKKQKISYIFYNQNNIHMNQHKNNIIWRQKLEDAIEDDRIVPFFQEIIDVKNPKNKKYEALIRMIEKDGKVISPFSFLNIAKEVKLYPQLTRIMINKTFEKFDKINAKFSINISIDDILNKETVEHIYNQLSKYTLKDKLIFELLESEEISDFEKIMPFINNMKSFGIEFAIDDFGSGYSNFSHLIHIKPDFIKIDGSLIKNIKLNSNEYNIVDAIVTFAKTLDAKVVAEHVSSEEIVNILEKFDIDYLQGFYFSEPSATL